LVRTTDTRLEVPPGILQAGQSYAIVIAATNVGNIDAPARNRLPDDVAQIASAIMTIGTAGDGGGGGKLDAGVAPWGKSE
jgi:hypothetical protein